ncbi:MAG: hypothetical protein H6747_09730 [Deltaproteobacteria bacterium]|nr:hypothetical protein [Deltaproteobacteria bacterium]
MARSVAAALLLVWLGFACSGPGPVGDSIDAGVDAQADGDGDADADAADAAIAPSTLGQHPAACGAADYVWLPRDGTTTAPGTLLAQEEVTSFDWSAKNLDFLLGTLGVKLPVAYAYDVRVFRIRYRTQDRGELTEATAAVALPIPKQGALEVDLMAYLHGTAGFSDGCAPSAKVIDPVAAAALASFGHVVVAPDYLGMKASGSASPQLHPYVIAEPTAIASFDAARATRALLAQQLEPELTARPGLMVLGGSQGGHAAMAMGAYGWHYAPDEPLVGVTASVPLIDVVGEALIATQSKTLGTENLVAILVAAAQWYGLDISTALLGDLPAHAAAHMASSCTLGGILGKAKTPEAIFTPALLQAAANGFAGDDPWSCVLRRNSMAHEVVQTPKPPPTLVALAENDELLDGPTQQAAYDALCAAGLPLRFLSCAGLSHTQGALASLPEQIAFLHDRRAGKPLAGSCARTPPQTCLGVVALP